MRIAPGKRKAPASLDFSSDSDDSSQSPIVTKRLRRSSTNTSASEPHLFDEEENEEAGAVVALTDENRFSQDAKRRYEEARNDFREAKDALRQWKVDNAGYTLSDPDLLQLKKDVNDAARLFQITDQALLNARAAARYNTAAQITHVTVPQSQWFKSDLIPIGPNDAITMEEWLEMTYNGNLLNLEMEDDQMAHQEALKRAGFKYFEMEFPVLIRKNRVAHDRVFVRPCYETLFELILQNIKSPSQGVGTTNLQFHPPQSISITGNPGIGKSQFYAYCAFRLSKEPLDGKILILNAGKQYFAFTDGKFEQLSKGQLNSYPLNPNVVRLIDGRSNVLLGWNGVSILFTSPGCPDYREFLKASLVEYIMPPWTLKELSIASNVVGIPLAEVQRRTSIFGGIPRFVFSPDPSAYDADITESISNVDLLSLFGAVNSREAVSEKNSSHRLVLMYPQHTHAVVYRGFYLDFSSEYIANRLYDKMVECCYNKMTEFIVANSEDSNSGGFRGTLFEIFCHRKWTSRGAAQLKGRSLSLDSQFLINVPDTVSTCRFIELMDIPDFSKDTPLYCRPIGKSCPCIDAIYWSGEICYLLQMTIKERHGILHAPLIKILNWLGGKPTVFVFVVPDDKVEKYKRQSFLTSIWSVYRNPTIMAQNLAQYVVGVKVISSLTSPPKSR